MLKKKCDGDHVFRRGSELSAERFEIVAVKAREMLADNNNPMVETDVLTKGGILGRAAAPIGTRPLEHEALDLRDHDKRYWGMGVRKAVSNVNNTIAPTIIGRDVTKQNEIDRLMINLDGTENKSKLGGNAILSVSLAVADAAARALEIPLYRYIGGVNANVLPIPIAGITGSYPKNLEFQEYLVMPVEAGSYSEALRMDVEVNLSYERLLQKKYGWRGYATYEPIHAMPIEGTQDLLEEMLKAIEEAGYSGKFRFYIDCAASHFYDREKKVYLLRGKHATREEMIECYRQLVKTYPISSLEDPLYQDDFEGHAILTKELGIQIVGDDLFVTNLKRIRRGIEVGAANALLLKPNQVGTLTETLEAVDLAYRNGCEVVVSGRAGQSDDQIPDICVAVNCGQTKLGLLGKRNAKYNRLLRIEEELGKLARYAHL